MMIMIDKRFMHNYYWLSKVLGYQELTNLNLLLNLSQGCCEYFFMINCRYHFIY